MVLYVLVLSNLFKSEPIPALFLLTYALSFNQFLIFFYFS